MTKQEQSKLFETIRDTMRVQIKAGRPVTMPNLSELSRPVAGPEAAGMGGVAPMDFGAMIESICGVADDSQEVEQYDGTLGVTQAFVAGRQSAAAQVQWNDNLAAVFTTPGNVSGVRWGSGTMIADDIFLTCGHLFDRDSDWTLPMDNVTGAIITSAEIAQNMHLNFNFQEDAAGNMRPEQSFPITDLLEFRLGGLDMAVCRIGGNPGQTFGRTGVSIADAAVGDMIAIIGHPLGQPKRIEAGPTTTIGGDAIRYNDIDTQGGNSGSGVLRESTDNLVGVHTNGGCNPMGTGSNFGTSIGAILRESPIVRNIAHAGRWVARHGLTGGQYQQAFDEQAFNGYRLLQVNAATGPNEVSYAALWEHTPGPGWVARHGITGAQYQAEFDALVPQGFRPTCVSGAGQNGQVLYAALFEQGAAPAWVARHGIDGAQYQAEFDNLVPQGFRPKFVNAATDGNRIVYATVFEQTGGPAFVARHGLTSAQYQAEFDNLVPQGFRPVWISGTGFGNEIIYAAIFEQRGGPAFVARHGLTSAQYQAEFDAQLAQGFRPVVVNGAGLGGQVFYAAVWEQR